MPDDASTNGSSPASRADEPVLQLAGMALRNGVLVIGPTHWGAAVRTPGGELVTASRRRLTTGDGVSAIPLLRGPVRLLEMLVVLPHLRVALPQARLPMESARLIGGSVVGSIAVRALRRSMGVGLLPELVGATVSLAVLMGALKGDRIAQYHGAEHKAIGGYEQGIPAAEATKEHERCGTHLAVPMLVSNTIALQAARIVLPRNPQAAALAGSIAGIGIGTELVRSLQRGGDSPVSRMLSTVGMTLQSLASTEEPDDEQLATAEAALAALLDAERADGVLSAA